MMNKILLLLTVFSFTSTQVLALSCGAACSFQETAKKANSGEHDCCPSKDKKDDKKKSSNCMGEVNGVCFHELAVDGLVLKKQSELTKKLLFISELPVLSKIAISGINHRYRQKVPNEQFLRYKSQLNIYILKSQFLI